MQQGRWYPTLLPLADGGVLAVSGLNENGTLNTTFEIYDPGTDSWHNVPVPQGGPVFRHAPVRAPVPAPQQPGVFSAAGWTTRTRRAPC